MAFDPGSKQPIRQGDVVRYAEVQMADPAHPGEVLRDDLAALGWTQCEAARKLGCARQSLGAVLNGRARLSAKLALALEAGGIGKAHMWMAMQSAYDLARARAAA